jgi:hypothetical protein
VSEPGSDEAREQRIGFDPRGIQQLLAGGIDILADCGDKIAIAFRSVLRESRDSANGKSPG